MQMGDEVLSSTIETHGWAVVLVEGTETEPNYAYSVGMFKRFEHDEVIVFGLSPSVMQDLINVIGNEIRGGRRFTAFSKSAEILVGATCDFRPVAPVAVHAYMGRAVRFYGEEFPAIHCIWPDRFGYFPWDSGTDPEYRRMQPMLSDGPEPHTSVKP